MYNLEAIYKKVVTPTAVGVAVFFVIAWVTWLLKDSILYALLNIRPDVVGGVATSVGYSRGSIVFFLVLNALFGLLIYVAVMHRMIGGQAQSLAEELTRDLSLSREQFQVLYENGPIPYFLMDDTGMIHHPNKATLRFFGGTVDECERINLFSILLSDTEQRTTPTLLQEKIAHGVPISREQMCIRTLSGRERWVVVSIHSVMHSTVMPLHHLVTMMDMTEEKESERVKSDFLLLASHQLRTPMTTIMWYIDYLLHTPSVALSDDVRQYLEEIDVGNQRMITLVNTLLTVSQIEMGTLAPEYVRVPFDEVIQDVLHELAPDIKKRRTQIHIVSNGDDTVVTDHAMLRVIIHNLLTNAIKYTPEGGTIDIRSEYTNSICTVSVKDVGCGIPLAEQAKIFTKMYRASNAKKVSASGTGLGLHLSRSFVKRLGGTLDFVSEENKGSEFTIVMPRIAPEA